MKASTAKHIFSNSINTGETHFANVQGVSNLSDDEKTIVNIKKFSYDGGTLTLWQTCSQVCTDGTGTKYQSPSHQNSTAHGYINAELMPYIVQPGNKTNDLVLGDLGVVVDIENDNFVYVIYSENGPDERIGEMSVDTFEKLGLSFYNKSTKEFSGYDKLRFITIMFPGSGKRFGYYPYNSFPKDYKELSRNAKICYDELLDGLPIKR